METTVQTRKGNRLKANKDLLTAGVATLALILLSVSFGHGGQRTKAGVKGTIRIAFFPNLTHAPALVGIARGDFQSASPGYRIESKVVNAGPDAMEALLAGEVDFAYVGPSPAVNTYLKSGGKALKILAGACSGGAALVSRQGVDIRTVSELDGRRVAVPQLGGTQDVSLRHFLSMNHLSPKENGGSVEILPVKNPDILALYLQQQIDAAWVPEPWASRLVADARAKVVVDEASLWPNHRFTTTVLVVSTRFSESHPDAVQQILRAHGEIISWLNGHSREAKILVNQALKKLTGKSLSVPVIDAAWSHLTFSSDPEPDNIVTMAESARDAGYLKGQIDLSDAFATRGGFTNEITRSRGGK